MARNDTSGRSREGERFDRARHTHDEAMAIIDLEREAMRKKTARLRKLRLAKEAEAGTTIIDKKPPARTKAASKKKK